MKILLYNVWNGITEQKKFRKLIKFVLKEEPDIVVLTELNHWQEKNFERVYEFKKITKYEHHSFIITKTGFNIGIFSKEEIKNEEKILKGFHHGLLKVKIKDLTILATHLNPYNPTNRLHEVKEILKHTNLKEKTILTGDLNSLSPHDNYDENDLLKLMGERKIIKFGKHKIEYTSIQLIENAGLHDAYLMKRKTFKHTAPTAANTDIAHLAKLRLDYFFINDLLKDNLEKIQIRQNSRTNQISDHFPIILWLKEE